MAAGAPDQAREALRRYLTLRSQPDSKTGARGGAADVDRVYVELVERGLQEGAYIAVATHDEAIIRRVRAFTAREGIARDRFEFQMLYGVRPGLQRSIAGEGYKVLVASPFGPDWYPYFMRRLAERPANVGFFLKNLVRR